MEKSTSKIIALVDPYSSGHHPMFFQNFTRILLELGHTVLAFCPQPAELKAWVSENFPIFVSRLQVYRFQESIVYNERLSRINSLFSTVKRWRMAATTIQNNIASQSLTPDLVFFPWLDSYLQPLHPHYVTDFVFPYRWAGLYFHPRHLRIQRWHSSVVENLLRPDRAIHSPNCAAFAILDEGVSLALQNEFPDKPVILFPDIADTTLPEHNYPVALQVRARACGRKVIGLLGSLGKRKGVLTLLKVAQQALTQEYFFLIAGRLLESDFTVQEVAWIKSLAESDNCLLHFERIPDEARFNELVDICDVLCAVYTEFPHSSNIIAKAAAFHKPIIVSQQYCMGERVRRFELGLTVPEQDENAWLEAIRKLSHPVLKEQSQLRFDFAGYNQVHSLLKLHTAFADLVATLDNKNIPGNA